MKYTKVGEKVLKNINTIKATIDKLNIPIDRYNYTFWNPYLENGKDEFHLYAYGGSLTKLYYSGRGLGASNFDKDYINHFSQQSVGEAVRTDFSFYNQRAKGVEYLMSWEEDTWTNVLEAFDAWSRKSVNSEYERRRQTYICRNHEDNKDFRIFVMEKNIKLVNTSNEEKGKGNPELDICGLRYEGGRPILSFTEYKCTTSAITGSTTLVKHFEDMIRYYQLPEQKELFIKLYNRKRLLLGEAEDEIDSENCDSEIVFLVSHIEWSYRYKKNDTGEKKKKKAQVIDPTLLLADLKRVAGVEGFEAHKNKLKVVFLEDETGSINKESMKSYDEAVEYLSKKIYETEV